MELVMQLQQENSRLKEELQNATRQKSCQYFTLDRTGGPITEDTEEIDLQQLKAQLHDE